MLGVEKETEYNLINLDLSLGNFALLQFLSPFFLHFFSQKQLCNKREWILLWQFHLSRKISWMKKNRFSDLTISCNTQTSRAKRRVMARQHAHLEQEPPNTHYSATLVKPANNLHKLQRKTRQNKAANAAGRLQGEQNSLSHLLFGQQHH